MLPVSQQLSSSLTTCIQELEHVDSKLQSRKRSSSKMRRFGLRSLKWPFGSKEVDQLLASLERHERTILLGLQIDQT